jgi:hypothetical protein
MTGRGSFSDSVTIYFRADCSELIGDRNLSVIYTQITATATCPAGTTRTGGGAELTGADVIPLVVSILANAPKGTDAWRAVAYNQFGGNAAAFTVTAYAVCVGS